MLLPIDALLAQQDFQPRRDTKIVTLFRNMWLLSILFEFHLISEQPFPVNAWRRAALSRISVKTPPIVVEEAQDYVLNDLEYNSIIRQNFAHTVWNLCTLYDG
jgi:phosphatidylinositol 4-kinase